MELKEAPSDIIPMERDTNETFMACDSCGQKSWYFLKVGGKPLSFCGHHATKYEVKLLASADEPPRDLRYLIGP